MTDPGMGDAGRQRQGAVYVRGVGGRRPLVPVGAEALEARAQRTMSPEAFAYVAGGAGSEHTMRANREAFARHALVPRVLRDASVRDLGTPLFGRALPAPLLLAPVGVLEMAHGDADLAVAQAAASLGVPFVFSSQASVAMEECAAVMGDAPRWFQLYWSRSDALVRSFVTRAERCGCDAIVLTLDTTMLGWRPRDLDLASLPFLQGMGIAQYTSDPVFRAELSGARGPDSGAPRDPSTHAGADASPGAPAVKAPLGAKSIAALLGMSRRFPGSTLRALTSGEARRAVQHFVATYSRPSLRWEDLATLRAMTRLPILLKGVLHADDARRAVDAGMDGVIVSNHGGRQVDHAIAALDALPGVVHAVDGACPVLFDSGIRTGGDVAVALAIGASAVLLGRPYVYGLALAGRDGVREVIENVLAELDLTMGLLGCRTVGELRERRA